MIKEEVESDFSKFNPKDYLEEYYSNIGSENRLLLSSLISSYKYIFLHIKKASLLEFGSGPTIYQLIPPSLYKVEIDVCDFLPENLKEINLWLGNRRTEFNWDKYFELVIKKEKNGYMHDLVKEREEVLRQKIKRVFKCDLREKDVLLGNYNGKYDIVSSHFVAESITTSKVEWEKYLRKIISLDKEHGFLVIGSIIGALNYRVGKKYFPSVPIDRKDVRRLLEENFFKIVTEDFVPAENPSQGYKGLHMVLAER